MAYLMIFLGGGLGSMLRYGLSKWNGDFNDWRLIIGTFLANIISCFVLGSVISYMAKHGLNDNARLLLLTGFCGGFSTFSTFSFEILQYIQRGNYTMGFIYLIASVILGITAIIIGMKVFS